MISTKIRRKKKLNIKSLYGTYENHMIVSNIWLKNDKEKDSAKSKFMFEGKKYQFGSLFLRICLAQFPVELDMNVSKLILRNCISIEDFLYWNSHGEELKFLHSILFTMFTKKHIWKIFSWIVSNATSFIASYFKLLRVTTLSY